MKLYWMYTGKKRVLPLLAILAVMVFAGYLLFPAEPDINPEEAIATSLKNTQTARSFQYSVKMTTTIDGQEQVNSNVSGQRENPARIHIQGRIFDSEMDFFLLDSVTYSKDPATGKWTKITDRQINQEDIFAAELNPLASFTYKELKNPRYTGAKKLGGRRVWVYTAVPVIDNPYMEMLWQNFKFEFWIEPRSLRVAKAEVTADSRSNAANKLTLTLEISDYNQDIRITPPVAENMQS